MVAKSQFFVMQQDNERKLEEEHPEAVGLRIIPVSASFLFVIILLKIIGSVNIVFV